VPNSQPLGISREPKKKTHAHALTCDVARPVTLPIASDPDTTTERSHTSRTGVGTIGLAQRLLTRLQRSAKVAHRYVPWVAAGLAFGLPLVWLAWTWAYPQAFDSLALRLGIGAVCLPLVWHRHWPRAGADLLPVYWALALAVALPWHGTLLMAANGYGQVWVLNLLAGAALLAVLQPWWAAVTTFIVGSAAGLLSVPALMQLRPDLVAPEPQQILTHLLVLCVAALVSVKLVRSGVMASSALAAGHMGDQGGDRRGDQAGSRTGDRTGDRRTAERRMNDLMVSLVNNSVLERLRSLETEGDPAKARRILNSRGQRFCSMMHADIRGFTRMVNASNELEVAELVAQAFAEVSSVGQDLSVVKGTGDGLFLYSDSDAPAEEAATHVLCLACLFLSGVSNVNQTMATPRGLPSFAVGVGLHAGETVHGNFGGPGLVDVTVMGRNVNLTQRLEELTKADAVQRMLGPSAIVLSEDFVALLRKAGLSLPGMRVLDLVELDCRVRDFPAITRLWGLNEEQALAFADQARQRIKAARQAKAYSEPAAAESVVGSTEHQALVPPEHADPNTGELSHEALLALARTPTPAEPQHTPRPTGPSEGFSIDGITLESLLNDASAAVVYVDRNWVARYCNATMAANLGLRPDQVLGRTPFEYTPTDFRKSIFYAICSQCIEEQRAFSQIGFSTVLSRWLVVNGFPIAGGGLMVAFEASTSALKAHHLETAQAPDPLTGLRNKLALEQHLQASLAKRESFVLALLSLRKFRDINETHGYNVGDLTLMQIASLLQSATQDGESVYRVSGDEFALVVGPRPATDSSAATPFSVKVAHERVRQLVYLLNRPLLVEGARIPVSGCAGTVSSPSDGDAFGPLLRRAGLALGEAKRQPGPITPIVAFQPALEEAVRSRVLLEQDLRQCLDGSQFELLLQPRTHLTNGAVLAAEALLRWHHPQRGLLGPGEFLPMAREAGLMRAIDAWVLRRAVELCAQLRDFGVDFPLTVNLSADALGDVLFTTRLSKDLAAAGVPARLVEIEISEGDLMSDVQASLRTLQSLSAMGVRLAIDHFGTGYPSSFSHLSMFPVDTIKVARSLVADIEGPSGRIVRSMARMAHPLGMNVVADGVETEEQIQRLQRMNFDGGQGFALAAPMGLQEFLAFVTVRRISTDSRPNPLTL
jgi:diguanylate cyclase (GGDEF)-like protein